MISLFLLAGYLVACAAPQTETNRPVDPGIEVAEPVETSFPTLEQRISPTPIEGSSTDPPQNPDPSPIPVATDTQEPPQDPTPTQISPTLTSRPSFSEDEWTMFPVIPEVSSKARDIFHRGLAMGNDPKAFSKIGDCQNVSSYFLSPFAYPGYYRLGEFDYLQDTIDWFKGSFTRESLAVQGGFNAAAVLSPLRANPKLCEKGESPLECELRLHNPSLAIISMETWWSGNPENYEKYMRQLIQYTIDQGVVPILATKADNLEGGHQINKIVSRLAYEFDIPLWNFWLAVQPLPNHGLTEDGFHLTLSNYFYDNPSTTQTGWSARNLTALQALDAVRKGVTEKE